MLQQYILSYTIKNLRKLLTTLMLTVASIYGFSQNLGVGTQNPKNKLHVVDAANPLRLEGLQNYIATDSAILITTADSGVVRYITIADLLTKMGGVNTDQQTLYLNGDSICITNGNCISLSDLVDSLETLTSIRNTDSTIVYYDENGDSTFLNIKAMIKANETVTTLTINADTCLIYTREDGVIDTICLPDYFKNETVTNMRLSPDTCIIYTREDGVEDTVCLPDLIRGSETITTMAINSDTCIIYTKEDGTNDTICLTDYFQNETVTNMVLNSDTCIIYTKEDGTNDTICLPDLIRGAETLTTMRLNSDTCIIYTREDGNNDTICLPDLIRGSETLTRIYTRDSSIVYFDENGDSTVLNIKDLVDSLETLTTLTQTDSTLVYVDENGGSTTINLGDSNYTGLFTYGPDGVLSASSPLLITIEQFNKTKILLTGTITVNAGGTTVLGTLDPSIRPTVEQYLLANIIDPTNSTLQTGTIVIKTTGVVEYKASLLASTVGAGSRVVINGFYFTK